MPWQHELTRELPELPPGPLALDIETTGLRHYMDSVVLVTVATPEHAWVVDVRGQSPEKVRLWLERLFQHPLVLHNAIFDLVFLRAAYGVSWPVTVWDTKLAEAVLRSGLLGWTELSLAALSKSYLGLELDKGLRNTFEAEGDLSEDQVRYAAHDTLVLHAIREAQERELERYPTRRRVVVLEHLAAPAFWDMQLRGVGIDVEALRVEAAGWEAEAARLRSQLQLRLTKRVLGLRHDKLASAEEELRRWQAGLEQALREAEERWRKYRHDPRFREALRRRWLGYQLSEKTVVTEEMLESWLDEKKGLSRYLQRVGQRYRREHSRPSVPRVDVNAPINLLSSQQLLEAVNGELTEAGLPRVQNTEAKTLRALLGRDPDLDSQVLRPLFRYKELEKLLDFRDQVLEHTVDEVLYPDWQQVGAATGRASCKAPNLMAQPKKAGFRKAFVAREGQVLITADYSQIELRIMAALSEDPEMVRAFTEGLDLHRITASRIFRVPEEEVKDWQRKVGKQVNFGTLYGMGPRRLVSELAAQGIAMSLEEAKEALESWRKTYAKAARLIREWGIQAVEQGYTETALGRRRHYPPPNNPSEAAAIERQGGNLPIQGTAADIMKLAMARLRHLGPVLQVHDELVLEVPEAVAEEAAEQVAAGMRTVAEQVLQGFPVEVDLALGKSWAEAEE